MKNRAIQIGLCVYLMIVSSRSLLCAAQSDARITEAGLTCGSSRDPDARNMIQIFQALMDHMSYKINERGWGAVYSVSTSLAMYALAECHRDLDSKQCAACFAQARESLPKCLPALSGRVFLDGCFLRYDHYRFFVESRDETSDICDCEATSKFLQNEPGLRPGFAREVASVVRNVTESASRHRFAVGGQRGGVDEVFALAQCWRTVDEQNCRNCLKQASDKILECVPGAGGRCMYTGCFLRYSTSKFYNGREEEYLDDHYASSKIGLIIAAVLSAIGLIFLISLGALLSWQGSGHQKNKGNNGSTPNFSSKNGLNFRYELLEKATDFFSPSKKLGQGGAGSVFKGTLPSGKTIAVKRLFFNTRQWADGFFNEVNLISGIEHKNLVKLMGCSIEGPESLLVYEYLPNGSLDQVLFGKRKGSMDPLTWQQRIQIIYGIAEGLAYLHGGCGTIIIHRDIKASNILLDDNLVPKIGDFGLACFISADKSHISTGIVGTLGYIAPEYLTRGQLTEKADVYGLGVLIIEIVCGRKNSIFTEGSSSVLHRVWKNYKASNITASVDPSLNGNFSEEEASKALRVGLLCVQSSYSQRPSMAEVLQMLTSQGYDIPSPKHQPFLNSSVMSPDDRTKTSTMSFLSPNVLAGVAADNSSSKSPRSSTSDENSTQNLFAGTTIITSEQRRNESFSFYKESDQRKEYKER